MTTVNTNLAALSALKHIDSTDKSMSKAMERLSSGLRINSAADDAAGSAIASKMESAVRSLSVAIRNSEDAISMTQTAEGALGEIENILQRIRELSVQASNSTLDGNDRDTIHMTAMTPARNTEARTFGVYHYSEGNTTKYFNATVTNNTGCSFAPWRFVITEIRQ